MQNHCESPDQVCLNKALFKIWLCLNKALFKKSCHFIASKLSSLYRHLYKLRVNHANPKPKLKMV